MISSMTLTYMLTKINKVSERENILEFKGLCNMILVSYKQRNVD